MKAVIVRYRVKPGMAAENERLIRDVFAQLQADKTAGLRYQSHKLPDGVSFVHVASYGDNVDSSPLQKLPAFQAFVADIKSRCDVPPAVQEMDLIGSFDSIV